MLASQIIYTACGKTKKGDFETWAKSADITAIEDEEICTKMSYRRLTEHPPYPTQEEIDTIFPKKFSYFKLSTGRYCIAQSTYVGRVYSEEDNRSGNYVMHGFVFDKPAAYIPVDFFSHPMFKRSLSEDEWLRADAPESLEQVNIPDSADGISDAELCEFFTPDRIQKLKMLVQAVIDSLSSDKKVTFHDNYDNLPYWYKGIALCLSEKAQSELTFCTFFTPGYTNSLVDQSLVNTDTKIRNIHPSRPGSPAFIYRDKAADGEYAFDFEAGIYPSNINISNFVDSVAELVSKFDEIVAEWEKTL